MTRTGMPTTWDERSTLTAMLDYARATVRTKCEGLSGEASRSKHLPRLIGQTARHNGHLDILRELTGGVTGA